MPVKGFFSPLAHSTAGASRDGKNLTLESAITGFGNSEMRKGEGRQQKEKLALAFVLSLPSRKSSPTGSHLPLDNKNRQKTKTKSSLFKLIHSVPFVSPVLTRRSSPFVMELSSPLYCRDATTKNSARTHSCHSCIAEGAPSSFQVFELAIPCPC